MVKVIVVDDDENIRGLVSLYLKMEGMDVIEAADGEQAMELLENSLVDLAIVDVMMPRKDGWEVCEELKMAFDDLPVIMLTAKSESMHRIHGLKLGADDYVTKPFEPMELVLRVKSILKRYNIAASQSITIGEIVLNRKQHTLSTGEGSQETLLPTKEFELLFKLASYPEQIFTREQLIEQIWGLDYEGGYRTIDVHIKRLRERLTALTGTVRICTIRGLGYRLEADR